MLGRGEMMSKSREFTSKFGKVSMMCCVWGFLALSLCSSDNHLEIVFNNDTAHEIDSLEFTIVSNHEQVERIGTVSPKSTVEFEVDPSDKIKSDGGFRFIVHIDSSSEEFSSWYFTNGYFDKWHFSYTLTESDTGLVLSLD